MKRLSLLLLCVLTVTVSAQDNPRLRARWGSTLQAGASVPRVTITSPTLQPTLTVSSSTLVLAGTAESTSASPITSVTWTNARGGSGSATGLTSWETASAAAVTVLQDTFTGVVNTNLAQLTASPVGGAWSEVINTGTSAFYLERRAAGYVQINSGLANAALAVKGTPSPAITGSNYDVSVTIPQANGDTDDGAAILFGYADSSNYCAAVWYGAAAATDLYLIKRVAGTVTTLGTPADVGPTANDGFSVEVRGTSLTVKQNGVSRITATDTFCDDANGVGFGVGAFRVSGDDGSTGWRFDDFTVVDQDASEGVITLQTGVNVITVTAEDGASNVGTDTLAVTYSASDAVDPVVTIGSPTTSPTYATSSGTLSLSGTATDNTGVSSVAWACATCTPTSGTATGTDSWSISAVALSSGSNTITVTAEDAAANEGSDTLTVTYTPSDSTDPTITITSPTTGTTHTTTTSPLTISGTSSDNVAVSSVRWTCDVCTGGNATGTSNWSGSVTLSPGDNVLTFIAADAASNEGTDSITVTYSPALTITTASMPSGTQNVAYSHTLTRVGGTAPFTWDNNAGGTSLGGSACTGLSISTAGVVSGTPTTIGTCSFTAKITDNAAATDIQALTINVQDPSEGPHAYFNDLIARGDCYKAASFRPLAGQTTPITTTAGVADCAHSRYASQLGSNQWVTYNFSGDTEPQKQDAAKVVIPVFLPTVVTLNGDIDASQTTITVAGTVGFENGRSYKFDNEIMTQVSRSGQVITVTRGQFGTTAASHTTGAVMSMNTNSLITQNRPSIHTDGSISATYVVTWDAYFTDSWVGSGLQNHKVFMLSSRNSGEQWWETQTRYAGPTEAYMSQPLWNPATDVAVITARRYAPSSPPALAIPADGNPARPIENDVPIVKPHKWVRFWIEVEANAEDDASKFDAITTLAADVADTTTTTITVSQPSSVFGSNPFSVPSVIAGANWPGRAIRIDSEIMTIVSADTSGETRNITVVRGAQGSTPATHLNGADVEVINDYVSMWVATEDTDPVRIYDRHPTHLPINTTATTARGQIGVFWVEFNTSQQQLPQGRADSGFVDLVAYVRNLAVLKDPPSDWSALRVRPVK